MKLVLALIGIVLLAGCAGSIRQPDPPDDLIGRDSMVVVLRELVVLESYLQTRYQSVNRYYKVMTASGKICLKKYHITPDRFERSYNYYVSRQPELQGIYTEVLDSLNREATEIGVKTTKTDDTTLVAPM
jgi:hypothetical protein